jgi:hypothetical protein
MDYRGQTSLPRGIRNNNPGNIKAGISWQGAVGDDGTFTIFADSTWGIRALAMDLINKITKDSLTTVRDIINVYAPPSENNTSAYVTDVASMVGVDPDDELTADQQTIHSLVRAVANHENGVYASQQYISDADIDTGIGMVSGGLSQVFQAGAIAVESNPVQSLLIAAGVVIVLDYFLAE